MATVAPLTSAESDTIYQRNHLAQAMVVAVARTGSGLALPEVRDFQSFWNSTKATTVRQMLVIGLSSSQAAALTPTLVVDGQYGPKTAGVLGTIVGSPLPPTRASGMTVWYAQNKDRVDNLAPMNTVPISEITTPVMPTTDPSGGVAATTTSIASGSTVRSTVQDATSPAITQPQPNAQGPVVVQPDTSGIIEPASHTTSKITIVDMTGPDADIPIVATPRKGSVPVLAVLAGGAALGGILYYFTRKGGGRRRARYA